MLILILGYLLACSVITNLFWIFRIHNKHYNLEKPPSLQALFVGFIIGITMAPMAVCFIILDFIFSKIDELNVRKL